MKVLLRDNDEGFLLCLIEESEVVALTDQECVLLAAELMTGLRETPPVRWLESVRDEGRMWWRRRRSARGGERDG